MNGYDPWAVPGVDGNPAAASDWRTRASAAAPRALDLAAKAQTAAMSDSLLSGIPNAALAAGAVLAIAALLPRRRRSRRGFYDHGDE